MKINTARLTLRPFAKEDAEDLYQYLSDPETVRFEPYEPFTRKQAQKEAEAREKNPAFIAVCLKDTGKLIGNLYLGKTRDRQYELGYVFNRAYWHLGYATEAAEALLRYAFTEMNTHRVCAGCDPRNRASEALMKRLGMRREALFRKSVSFRTDPATGEPVWQDSLAYAILEEEWRKADALRDR